MRRPDYRLCDQTVTVYRRNGRDDISRTVFDRAFLDIKKVRNVEKTGSDGAMSFLLVIPGNADVREDDKAIHGEGPEIGTDAEWQQLVPSKVRGLCVVRWADPKYLGGEVCHIEAGG